MRSCPKTVQLMVGLNISSYQCLMDLFYKGSTSAINCEDKPLFAASLIVELHKINGEFQIALKFNGKYMNPCNRYGQYCGYKEFKSRIVNQLTTEHFYERKCKVNGSLWQQYVNGLKNENFWVIACTVQLAVIIVLVVLVICKKKKQKLHRQQYWLAQQADPYQMIMQPVLVQG